MLVEATQLISLPVESSTGQKLGSVASCIFNGQTNRLAGFSVDRPGLLKKAAGLSYEEALLVSKTKISVDAETAFAKDTEGLETLVKRYGPVINVTAKTESGQRIGRVTDVFLEAESGLIVRFYLRNLLREQIIPRQFLVSLTPQAVIFKDIVDQPVFNQVATAEAGL